MSWGRAWGKWYAKCLPHVNLGASDLREDGCFGALCNLAVPGAGVDASLLGLLHLPAEQRVKRGTQPTTAYACALAVVHPVGQSWATDLVSCKGCRNMEEGGSASAHATHMLAAGCPSPSSGDTTTVNACGRVKGGNWNVRDFPAAARTQSGSSLAMHAWRCVARMAPHPTSCGQDDQRVVPL